MDQSNQSKTIPLAVVIDGHTIEVPGAVWIAAFAMRGIPWAVKEMEKPEVKKALANFERDWRRRNRWGLLRRATDRRSAKRLQ